MAATDEEVLKLHQIGAEDCPVAMLDCTQPFGQLTQQEKLYAHYLGAAGFEGTKICLFQTSYESPAIFELLHRVFASASGDVGGMDDLFKAAAFSDTERKQLTAYYACFLGNMGNYKSFGDTKFVPALPQERMHAFICASPAYKADKAVLDTLWAAVAEPMYSLQPSVRSLGLGEDGVSGYYSARCTKADAENVQAVMVKHNISGYNTRLFKQPSPDAPTKTRYQLRVASAVAKAGPVFENEDKAGSWDRIEVVFGDHAPFMQRIVDNLKQALRYAANETEQKMIQAYIKCFAEGDIEDHKEGSRHWIRDKGPAIESYIGFIESYQDPFGVRGEWEGFAAVVNREISAKFGSLVDAAERFLPMLPWPREFEKDKFLKPDFTALEVLAFGSGGVPAGINIPNYDDIRQNEGFKNVSLSNVLRAGYSFGGDEWVTFLRQEDQTLYKNKASEAFDVQVGIHELLGHGSGKLFMEDASGSLNFDKNAVTNPVKGGQPIDSWYKPGQTWDSQFPSFGSSYEECRAESIGIYLSTELDVLRIFGFEGAVADDVMYINWLHMVRAGLLALQFYTPGKEGMSGWGQAHMMARFAILQVLLEAGQGFVTLTRGSKDQESRQGTFVSLDRAKILTVGRPAIGDFLCKLQTYKSTADTAAGREMYAKYTFVNDDMLALRAEVMANRKPRRLFVQHVTSVSAGGRVDLQSFEPTTEGMIRSFVKRFPASDGELLAAWQATAAACNPYAKAA
eukprot:m.119961 g.119961  ORF g.119961 m.119961 type:complete len:739 (-) comp16167_c0_seq2:171-2387(-)